MPQDQECVRVLPPEEVMHALMRSPQLPHVRGHETHLERTLEPTVREARHLLTGGRCSMHGSTSARVAVLISGGSRTLLEAAVLAEFRSFLQPLARVRAVGIFAYLMLPESNVSSSSGSAKGLIQHSLDTSIGLPVTLELHSDDHALLPPDAHCNEHRRSLMQFAKVEAATRMMKMPPPRSS